jgi:hypothetical protein
VPGLLTDEPVHLQKLDERSNRPAENSAHAHGPSCHLHPQELPKGAALGADVQADYNHGPAQVRWSARAADTGTETANGCAVLVSDVAAVPTCKPRFLAQRLELDMLLLRLLLLLLRLYVAGP